MAKKILMILGIFIIIITTFGCAKKSDDIYALKEFPLIRIDLPDSTTGIFSKVLKVTVLIDEKAGSSFVNINNIRVELRKDGKTHTSFLFFQVLSQEDKYLPQYNGGIILVPIEKDIAAWQQWLADQKSQIFPQRVLPGN